MNPLATSRAAVLVTGAGKGIGEACVSKLSQSGFTVYAGVRRAEDAERWEQRGAGRVRPLLLEVDSEASVRAAAEELTRTLGDLTLRGLVNNAGIAVAGPLEFLPLAELRRQLEVNVVGQIAVTQAVLPLLRSGRGRIVNIGSVSGRSALPMTGAYAASKFAMEALTDALRVELLPAGVDVIIVEPGMIATPIWQTSLRTAEKMMGGLPPQAFQYYGKVVEAVRRRAQSGDVQGLPATVVADVVYRALTATRPRTRYVIGRDARLRLLLERLLPDRMRDRIIARQLAKV